MQDFNLGIGQGADAVVNYVLDHFMPLLDAISAVIGFVTGGIQGALTALPAPVAIALIALLALWRVGWKFAVFAVGPCC
jgi:glycine betaine/proline transport system permease protein